MTIIQTIHVSLTPFQIRLLDNIRRQMPHLSAEKLQAHVAAMGILSIGQKMCEDRFSEQRDAEEGIDAASAGDHQVEREITIALNEGLRQRLERLLAARPDLPKNEVFAILIDIGLESLIELGIVHAVELAPASMVEGAASREPALEDLCTRFDEERHS